MDTTLAKPGAPEGRTSGQTTEDTANDDAGQIGARIDALPASLRLWGWVALIAVGGFFEIYDLALASPLSPGLVAAGIFRTGNAGFFGFSDQATFIAATFLGLYFGVVGFAAVGDRLGRKAIFGYALISYAIATFIMGMQNEALWICFWRFVAGIGLGAESVAIDCFVVEIIPKRLRGKAFGMVKSIEYTAIPAVMLLSTFLIPQPIFGVAGWRWLAFVPVVGGVAFWIIRRNLPESPRWLASQGRVQEAKMILDRFDGGHIPAQVSKQEIKPANGRVHHGYVRKVIIMMIIYFVFQNISYYGFHNWVPTLLEAQGVPLKSSLLYTFGVTLAAPLAPILVALLADRFERKYQLIVIGLVSIILGLLFAKSVTPIGWISFGIGLTFTNAALSFHGHAYQSEIFPTAIRARTVGFVYSFTRLAAAISGYVISFTLTKGGVMAVFLALSVFMLIALAAIAIAGPKTRNRSFEEITGQP